MKVNTGGNERVMRVFTGLIILAAGLIIETYWSFVGIGIIVSGVTGVSLFYQVLGISTCERQLPTL